MEAIRLWPHKPTRTDGRAVEAPSPASGPQRTAADAHAYVSRDDGNARARGKEDVDAVAHGNMPNWASENPGAFWQATERHIGQSVVLVIAREAGSPMRSRLIRLRTSEHEVE